MCLFFIITPSLVHPDVPEEIPKVWLLTTAQAEALQADWKRYKLAPCSHLSRELGHTEEGYLTGMLHCVDCGKTFSLVTTH